MIYFDNAATSFPKPECVRAAINECIGKYGGNPGRGAHKLSVAAANAVFNCRTAVSRMFHVAPENVIFTYNATYALNIAINALSYPGIHILFSEAEHNSVIRPVSALVKRGFATADVYSSFCSPEQTLESIKSKLRPNTGLIICNHVSNLTSRQQPINEISRLCRKLGIRFIIDASQSAGAYKINAGICDALVSPGHKGLQGPQGTGILIMNTDKVNLPTLVVGGGGSDSFNPEMPQYSPDRFEAGTLNTPGIFGLYAGINYVEKLGIDNIFRHETALGNRLRKFLCQSDKFILYDSEIISGGTVMFNIVNKTGFETARILDNYGVCTRAGYHCAPLTHKVFGTDNNGAVRASFGIFNNTRELDYLFSVLEKIAKQV